MASQTIENYLKAIYNLALEQDDVNISELAYAIGISLPSVNSMAKKLSEKGYVVYEKYKPLKITSAGKIAAALIIRKHRLTEMFLVEKMGFGWEEVHQIAEQIEHIESPAFFNRMDELLGFPTVDPHGSPIPDRNGVMQPSFWLKLAECNAGEKLILRALHNPSDAFLTYLNQKSIQLGSYLEVLHKETFDSNMTVQCGLNKHVLSVQVTEKLLVEKCS